MYISKSAQQEWEEKVKEGVFFLVGVEIETKREGTFIDILRHFAGNVRGIPSIEKGLRNKGKFAKGMVIDEFVKTQFDAGLMLRDAPEKIINDIVFVDGHLHNYIKDLFVDCYFKLQYDRIVAYTKEYKTVSGLLNSVNPEQAAKDLQKEIDEKPIEPTK